MTEHNIFSLPRGAAIVSRHTGRRATYTGRVFIKGRACIGIDFGNGIIFHMSPESWEPAS